MPKTTVYYYTSSTNNNPFAHFLDSLQKKQQAKILRVIFQIGKYGLLSILPHIKKLTGTPLWEIRILGKDNLRIVYIIPHQNSVLVLHGFIKKTQKTPYKEIAIALNRFKDWQTHHCK